MTSHTPLFPRTAIVLTIAAASAVLPTLHAETLAPDVMIRQLSTEVIDAVKGDKAIQAGDIGRLNAKIHPTTT